LDADYVIVGAGCAGLSLAVHLAARGHRLAVVDPRTTFSRDRTWCFWDVHDHPFAGAVAHRWRRWRVRGPGADVVCGPGRYAYHHLPADRFYAAALAALRQAPGVRLLLGTRAGAVADVGPHARVETDRGVLRARAVFDSRPAAPGDAGADDAWPAPAAAPAAAGLAQQFVGLFVRADRPVFDAGAATLMHFDAPGPGDEIRFTYLLPFSAREALVEATAFAPAGTPETALHDALARHALDYLADQHRGVGLTVTGTEHGRLPMVAGRTERRPSRRVYRIGVAGGLAKPSTGYAFLAIQRDAAGLAQALARTELPEPPRPRGACATFLDAVFLAHLRRHPAAAPALFARLFARAPADALVRFLSDTATAADVARVVGALPVWPFVAEAARQARPRRLRGQPA
jgi:lycopene beta-cyclase